MQSTTTLPRTPQRPFQRTAVDFLAIWAGVAALILAALFAGWQYWHADRIYTGVRVAGEPVGGMSQGAALAHLSRVLNPYPAPPVRIQWGDQVWTLSAAALDPRPDLASAVTQAYLVGRRGGSAGQIAAQWSALLGRWDVQPQVTYDEASIRQQISQIAATVRRPGRPALQVGEILAPSRPAVDVDVDATAQLVLQALAAGEPRVVPLQTISAPAPDASTATVGAGSPALSPPLVLQDPASGLSFALDPAALDRILPGGDVARLDEEALREVVEGWAEQIYIPPQDARLRFDVAAGRPVVIQPSITGRRLNVEQAAANVRAALAEGRSQAPLPVESVVPQVDSTRVDQMGIKELVATGTTYFAGSSRARIYNIEVAAEKFEGVVIPPGGIFSFNAIVQDVSAANGFEDSLIIWGDRTAVGVGGGVCQVSTTVFRAAYLGGFPLVERYNHGYVVSWYGEPGLDATIFTPNVDFKFRNDTDAYLLIQPLVDSVKGVITFAFYGTKPDRQVIVSEPVMTDVIEPGEPVYQLDESLAQGQIRQVEWPKKGMTVTVERTVVENGQTRTDTLTSVYQPWNAVYLYGPGTQIPGVTGKQDQAPEPAASGE